VSCLHKGTITKIIIRTTKQRIQYEAQFSHVRMQSIYTLTSTRTWAPNQGDFTTKPNHSKFCSLASVLGMKIDATTLPIYLRTIYVHLPQLIVKLIPLGEAFGGWNATKAHNRSNILWQLNHSVGHKLMNLYPIFQQNGSNHRMRKHP
jgi:hypothetical protein